MFSNISIYFDELDSCEDRTTLYILFSNLWLKTTGVKSKQSYEIVIKEYIMFQGEEWNKGE